jgi:hypothetical protein
MNDWLFVLYTTIAGLMTIGMGQVFEALREIALNTRETARKKGSVAASESGYVGLKTIAGIYTLVGTLIIIGGLAAAVYNNRTYLGLS